MQYMNKQLQGHNSSHSPVKGGGGSSASLGFGTVFATAVPSVVSTFLILQYAIFSYRGGHFISHAKRYILKYLLNSTFPGVFRKISYGSTHYETGALNTGKILGLWP